MVIANGRFDRHGLPLSIRTRESILSTNAERYYQTLPIAWRLFQLGAHTAGAAGDKNTAKHRSEEHRTLLIKPRFSWLLEATLHGNPDNLRLGPGTGGQMNFAPPQAGSRVHNSGKPCLIDLTGSSPNHRVCLDLPFGARPGTQARTH